MSGLLRKRRASFQIRLDFLRVFVVTLREHFVEPVVSDVDTVDVLCGVSLFFMRLGSLALRCGDALG